MRRNVLLYLLVLPLLAAAGSPVPSAWAQGVPGGADSPELQARSMPVPMSEAAAPKVDPRIRLALARTDKTEWSYAGVGRNIVLSGEEPAEIRFPVLIRTTLSDAELAELGAIPDSRAGDIVTAEVLPGDVDRLASHPAIRRIEASYWLAPTLDVSIPEVRADLINQGTPPSGYTGDGILFGLMDDGIDITHQDFIDTGGSRILYIWDHYKNTNNGPPSGYTYGHEYSKADIDGGLAGEFVNSGGHGSHVAGIAVGDGSSLPSQGYKGVAWEADIIAVRNGYCDLFCYGSNNPFYTYWDGGGTTKGSIDGLNYMLDKADALGRPLVVNQSQGVTLGPHDGSTLFEQAYQNLIDARGLIIAIAAGNDQRADWHGRATVSPGSQASFTITKDNSEASDQWFQFECWGQSGDRFTWQVVTPGSQTINIPAAVSPANEFKTFTTSNNDTAVYWSTAVDESNGQPMLVFYAENQNGVQGGNWQVRAIADNALPSGGQVDLYCERNQYTVEVTSNLSTASIVGMPGTTEGAITVASYNTKNQWNSMDGPANANGYPLGEISRFSSHGPRRDGAQKPDISAPGAFVMSAFAAGSDPQGQNGILRDPGGVHICFSGTSMAAPHVSGAIALMLQKQGDLTPAQVKSILQETARTDGFTGSVPNYQFGHGKLDVKAAVDMVGEGPGECATEMGDANGTGGVNVLDVVATVNHILDIVPLDAGGQACADVQTDGSINVLDVVGVVNIILDGVPGAPLVLGGGDGALDPVAWSESFEGSTYRLTLDGSRLSGIQMSYYLPRGYEAETTPALIGADPGAQVALAGRGRQQTLIVYQPQGGALAGGEFALKIPVRRAWEGGQSLQDFGISHMILSDPNGRSLVLAPTPTLQPQSTESGGIGLFLARTAPNPSPGTTRIEYVLDSNGPVHLSLYDASGRRVRDLWSGWQMAGAHSMAWDGRDDAGGSVPAGVYFVQLKGGALEDSRKILVVR